MGWRRRWSCRLGVLKPPNPAVLNLCLPAPGQDHLCSSVTPTNHDLGTFAHFTPLETQRNLVSDASFLPYFYFYFILLNKPPAAGRDERFGKLRLQQTGVCDPGETQVPPLLLCLIDIFTPCDQKSCSLSVILRVSIPHEQHY